MKVAVVVLIALFGGAMAQGALELLASAGVGGSSATGAAQGLGDSVTGSITADVTPTSSSTTSIITATGSSTISPTPTPTPTPAPVPTPVPTPKPAKKVHAAPVKPAPKVVAKKVKEPVCEDLKNGTCADIEKYEHCGFCIVDKYPTVGSGCTYTKKMVKKDGKKGEYEVELVPKCHCNGTFILEHKSCPTCEAALEELLVCAKAKADAVVEIPAKCIEKVGVSIEYLVKCGYVEKKEKKEKEVDPNVLTKKYVEEKEDPKIMIVKKEKDPKPASTKYVMAPTPTTPSTPTSTPVSTTPFVNYELQPASSQPPGDLQISNSQGSEPRASETRPETRPTPGGSDRSRTADRERTTTRN